MPQLLLISLLAGCAEGLPGFSVGGAHRPTPGGTSLPGGDDPGVVDSATPDSATPDSATPDSADAGIPGGDGCGFAMGQVACDLAATDQDGAPFALWDLHGAPVVLGFGSAWEPSFASTSATIGGLAAEGEVEVVLVLLDGADLQPADAADARAWASAHGLPRVVVGLTPAQRAAWVGSAAAHTRLLDASLRLRWEAFGALDEASLRGALDALD